jgi:hypothetical protein
VRLRRGAGAAIRHYAERQRCAAKLLSWSQVVYLDKSQLACVVVALGPCCSEKLYRLTRAAMLKMVSSSSVVST